MYQVYGAGLFPGLDPTAGVDEGVDPGSYLVLAAVCGIETALPGGEGPALGGEHCTGGGGGRRKGWPRAAGAGWGGGGGGCGGF